MTARNSSRSSLYEIYDQQQDYFFFLCYLFGISTFYFFKVILWFYFFSIFYYCYFFESPVFSLGSSYSSWTTGSLFLSSIWDTIKSMIVWKRFSMFLPVLADTSKWEASCCWAYCSPYFLVMHFYYKSALLPTYRQWITNKNFNRLCTLVILKHLIPYFEIGKGFGFRAVVN